jgi:hypothetical protein
MPRESHPKQKRKGDPASVSAYKLARTHGLAQCAVYGAIRKGELPATTVRHGTQKEYRIQSAEGDQWAEHYKARKADYEARLASGEYLTIPKAQAELRIGRRTVRSAFDAGQLRGLVHPFGDRLLLETKGVRQMAQKLGPPSDRLSVPDVARLQDVTPTAVRYWIDKALLRALTVGTKIVIIRRDDYETFRETRSAPVPDSTVAELVPDDQMIDGAQNTKWLRPEQFMDAWRKVMPVERRQALELEPTHPLLRGLYRTGRLRAQRTPGGRWRIERSSAFALLKELAEVRSWVHYRHAAKILARSPVHVGARLRDPNDDLMGWQLTRGRPRLVEPGSLHRAVESDPEAPAALVPAHAAAGEVGLTAQGLQTLLQRGKVAGYRPPNRGGGPGGPHVESWLVHLPSLKDYLAPPPDGYITGDELARLWSITPNGAYNQARRLGVKRIKHRGRWVWHKDDAIARAQEARRKEPKARRRRDEDRKKAVIAQQAQPTGFLPLGECLDAVGVRGKNREAARKALHRARKKSPLDDRLYRWDSDWGTKGGALYSVERARLLLKRYQ